MIYKQEDRVAYGGEISDVQTTYTKVMPGAEDRGMWCVTVGKFSKEVKRKEVFEGEIKRIENFFPYGTWGI